MSAAAGPRGRHPVAVVGGGVAGLRCALALTDAGVGVVLYEAQATLGGRASNGIDAATGDAVDIGPHVLTSEHRNFCGLLERVGRQDQVVWQRHPLTTLLDGGRRLTLPSWPWPAPLQALPVLPSTLRSVRWHDLLSNLQLFWRVARCDEQALLALDVRDALGWLRSNRVTQRFIDWFWTPICLALLNVPLQRCSAAALMRLFRLLIGRSGYHFGFPRCGLGELYAPACRRAIEAGGGRVVCARRVEQVLFERGRCVGVRLDGGERVRARHVVLAVPPDALPRLGLPWRPSALETFEPCPYVSTMLWLDRPVTRHAFWARVWTPADLNLDFYDLSNIRRPPGATARAPSLIACNAIHAHAAQGWDDARIVARTLQELREFAPRARSARVRHAVIHRIPMAIPCPLPGSESRRPPNRTPLPGVWLAGDWTDTGLPASMESAARSGALAAEQVAAALGRPLQLTLPPPRPTGMMALLDGASAGAPSWEPGA